MAFMHGQEGVVRRALHCVDVFGASRRVEQAWKAAGYCAAGFDIKLSNRHDICSERGMKTLLALGLQQLELSLAVKVLSLRILDVDFFMMYCI